MGMDNLNETLGESQDYKGRLFLGRVVNDQDPSGAGAFQASVPGLFEEGELPWIGRIRESPFGIGPNFGTYGTPHVGSSVIIELQDGDANYPVCVGFYPKAAEVPDVFKNGRVWGYRDPSGTTLVVNPDEKLYHFTHASGTEYSINQDGELTANIVNNTTVNISGNAVANVSGSVQINVSGNATLVAPSVLIDSPETTFSGKVTIQGLLQAIDGMNISGGSGAFISGNLTHSDGVLRSNNVSVDGHEHVNVGPPIPGT